MDGVSAHFLCSVLGKTSITNVLTSSKAPGFTILVLYNFYFGMLDHSGIKFDSWFPWQNDSTFHDLHHEYFHVNFGQNLSLWDKIHGTVRDPSRFYDETTFGGHGK